MRWTSKSYPEAMRKMEKSVRNKAIEIANALISGGGDENSIVKTAITRAMQWAQNRKHKNISIDGLYFREGFNFPYEG